MQKLIEDAKTVGYGYALLDTLPEMQNALKLYQKYGFVQTQPYYDNPYLEALCFSLKTKDL